MISAGSRWSLDRQRRCELAGRPGAEQGSGDAGSVADPEQGHLQRGQVQPVRRPDHRLDHAAAAGLQVRLDEPREVVRGAPATRAACRPVLPGQHAAAERRPREQAHAEGPGGRQHLDLGAAGQQGVLHLGAADRRPPGNADCQVAACAVCQPTKLEIPA